MRWNERIASTWRDEIDALHAFRVKRAKELIHAGKTLAEMADEIGVPPGTLRAWFKRHNHRDLIEGFSNNTPYGRSLHYEEAARRFRLIWTERQQAPSNRQALIRAAEKLGMPFKSLRNWVAINAPDGLASAIQDYT